MPRFLSNRFSNKPVFQSTSQLWLHYSWWIARYLLVGGVFVLPFVCKEDFVVDEDLLELALDGGLKKGVYRNPSLGFSVAIPKGWVVHEPDYLLTEKTKPVAFVTDRPGSTVVASMLNTADKKHVVKIEAYFTSSIEVEDSLQYANLITTQIARYFEEQGALVSMRIAGDTSFGRLILVGMLNVQETTQRARSVDIYFIRNGAISFDVVAASFDGSGRGMLRDVILSIQFKPVNGWPVADGL